MGNAASAPVVVDHRTGRGGGATNPPPLPRPSLPMQQRTSSHSNSQQMPSKPPPPPRRSSGSNNNNNHKAVVVVPPGPPRRPPPQLTSSEPFLVISPASDVSNPSNFHHLKRRARQTPVRDRRRASKVFHTQPAENHNHHQNSSFVIARPDNFYVSDASRTMITTTTNLERTGGVAAYEPHPGGAVGVNPTARPSQPTDDDRNGMKKAAPLLRGDDEQLHHRPPGALQRVKQALVGCLQDVLLIPSAQPVGRNHHHSRNYYGGGAGAGHIQLVSTQSTLSPVDDYDRRALYDSDRGFDDPVPPDTAGFVRRKPVDPNIPSSVEVNFAMAGGEHGGDAHPPSRPHPFASILESADDEEDDTTSGRRNLASAHAPTQQQGGRDSPVCLLFADEANHEPNFSTSVAVHRNNAPARRPEQEPQQRGPYHHDEVVDESAYLPEHPSALYEEPSHLLQVSGHEAFRAASTSFGIAALKDPDDDDNEDRETHQQLMQRRKSHNKWLNLVLDIQQQSRNDLYEHKKLRGRRSAPALSTQHGAIVAAPSFGTESTSAGGGDTGATTVTGPALDASKATATSAHDKHHNEEQERIRQAVADNVQSQINAKLLLKPPPPPPPQPTRGRSAEPRQRRENRGAHAAAPGRCEASGEHSIENESIVQRNRKIFESQGCAASGLRSSSMPPSPAAPRAAVVNAAAAARKAMRNSRSRSSSLPNRRSLSTTVVKTAATQTAVVECINIKNPPTLPALLQLAGWQPPPPSGVAQKKPPPPPSKPLSEAEGKPKPLPGLLQLSSSWNANAGGGAGGNDKTYSLHHRGVLDPNKRLSDPFPLRRQANLGNNASARQRHSEPLPQRRLPATARSSDVGVREIDRNENAAVARKSNRPSSTSIAVQTSPVNDAPQRLVIKDNQLTIAHMLAQTYPLGRSYSDDEEEDDVQPARRASSTAADYMKYTFVAPTQDISTQSPGVMSATATDGMSPAFTHAASSNADFLFTSDAQGHYRSTSAMAAPRPPPTFSISTVDSLHRVSGLTPFAPRFHSSMESVTMPPTPHAVESLTMPPVHDDDRPSLGAGSHESVENRHVRFTDSTQKREAFRSRSTSNGDFPVVTTYPAIDSKLSDLTDTNNHHHQQQQLVAARSFDSAVSSTVHPTIHEGVEEDVKDDASDASVGEAELKLSTPTDLEREEAPMESAAKNWAYRQQGGQGVTPYRNGSLSAANGQTSHVTNSPFVRFKEARSKFTSTKEPPVKRSSPSPKAKWIAGAREGSRVSGGLVHQRIAAMEAARSQAATSPIRTTKPKAMPLRVRRETTGHDAIAPRKSTLVSPLFRPVIQTKPATQASAVEPPSTTAVSAVAPGPTISSRTSIGSQQIHRSRDSTSTAESEYGEIKQATIIDEDSSDSTDPSPQSCQSFDHEVSPATQFETRSVVSEEEDEDAFAALLQGDDSDEDSDDEEGEDETVSTILQTHPSMASGVTKYANFRLSSGETKSASGSSVSTMKRHRLSFLSSDESTTASSKMSEGLAFRDESLVRPNEQKPPKNAKGRLFLSPMQRTPMQARKWRALAAEAKASNQSKPHGSASASANKGSLSERHPNVVHPWR